MESTNERGKENEVEKIKVTVSENKIRKSIAMVGENQIETVKGKVGENKKDIKFEKEMV